MSAAGVEDLCGNKDLGNTQMFSSEETVLCSLPDLSTKKLASDTAEDRRC